jgi:hypothetical protein
MIIEPLLRPPCAYLPSSVTLQRAIFYAAMFEKQVFFSQ